MKKQLSTNDAPSADHILSQGLISDGLVFVSGQVHVKPDGDLIEGSVADKVDQIMRNIEAILNQADAGMSDVVKVVIYLTEMSQLPELNEVYPKYFKKPYPVREAVGVSALPLGATLEISVIASLK